MLVWTYNENGGCHMENNDYEFNDCTADNLFIPFNIHALKLHQGNI